MNKSHFMEIIKTNVSYLDHTEGFEKVLKKFEEVVTKSDEPALEIGTNMGGSALSFMQVLFDNNKKNYIFGVDPYGSILYHNGVFAHETSVYSNVRYTEAMIRLFSFAKEHDLGFSHFKQTSEDFMLYTFPNLKIYGNGKAEKVEKFSFVYLDGSHDPEVVKKEILFFVDLMDSSGVVIVDDFEGSRFPGFLDVVLKNKDHLTCEKTKIPQRLVIEYK